MGVREVTKEMLRRGFSPSRISQERKVGVATTFKYLDELIGRGIIRRTEILSTIPAEVRKDVHRQLAEGRYPSQIVKSLEERGVVVDQADIAAIQKYGQPLSALGDMYEYLHEIETGLHALLRRSLEEEYGKEESGWWRKGIPTNIRVECQKRREEDETDDTPQPYCYTDLIHLKEIIANNWKTLSGQMPEDLARDRKRLLTDLLRLNRIRRAVMHPVRNSPPSEDDFTFVVMLRRRLESWLQA